MDTLSEIKRSRLQHTKRTCELLLSGLTIGLPVDEVLQILMTDGILCEAEISDGVFVGQSTVSRWKTGTCMPSGRKRAALFKLIERKLPDVIKRIEAQLRNL